MKNILNQIGQSISKAKKVIVDANLPQKARTAYRVAGEIIEENIPQSVKDRRSGAVYTDLKKLMTPEQYASFKENNKSPFD